MTHRRILIVGAGSAGRMAARAMLDAAEAGFRPVAFIDDDPAKQGTSIEGVPVAGGRDAIPRALADTGAEEILIALPSVHGPVIREIIETCRQERVHFRIVPGIWEIIRGDVHIEQIRPVEPEDLLGRDTVEPNRELLTRTFQGKRILVTGGGGSIGRELARQILTLDPARLVLLGRGENSLFESRMSLPETGRLELALVDLRNTPAVTRVFEETRPEVVLHAAAHKHVTFMEAAPEEAIQNNVLATRDLLDLCPAVAVERFVMVSTDKAVNPRSVMGASKRVAELLVAERAAAGGATRLMTVRFGNVLGSRGSVVPLFMHQIARGGPVTVSDPEVARYFMTLREAVLLVLEATGLGEGGEVFTLDMGDQIRILDLAHDLITLSGFRPGIDIPITFTGLKPGEKGREALVHEFETLIPTANPRIRSARGAPHPALAVGEAVDRLGQLARAGDRAGIRRELSTLLPEAALADPAPAGDRTPGDARGA